MKFEINKICWISRLKLSTIDPALKTLFNCFKSPLVWKRLKFKWRWILWNVKTNLCFHYLLIPRRRRKPLDFSPYSSTLCISQKPRRSMNEMSEQGRPNFLEKLIAEEKACLKGQCREIFCLWFFFVYYLPLQASDNSIRVISNFSINKRRYLQVKVHHRGWGEPDSWKKPKVKNLVTWSLKNVLTTLFSKQGSRTASLNIYNADPDPSFNFT